MASKFLRGSAVAALLLVATLGSSPARAADWQPSKELVVSGAYYGVLYGIAVTAVGAISLTIGSLVAPAYVPVATALGTPAAMVVLMSNAVPWAAATVPVWAAESYEQWFTVAEARP